jgi:hypothetical protein
MADEITQRGLRNNSGEIVPFRRHRFVRAETVVEAFRCAPVIDYQRFRVDLDEVADPGAPPPA